MILITGGAGFIGSNFVLDWLAQSDEKIVNLDKLTYAGNLQSLSPLMGNTGHIFVQGDIGDIELVSRLLAQYQPRAIINFAAESHVDRSINGPEDFIQTNILGRFRLLEAVHAYWNELETATKQNFRFLHVSTRVEYRVSSFSSQEQLDAYLRRRCAELTLREGYDFFHMSQRADVLALSRRTSITLTMFKGKKPEGAADLYDSKEVLALAATDVRQ